jgi:catechol 2,3-dioxygenase-like lactoylglutathione lyase family enzyme
VSELRFKSANTILYCKRWKETVAFYQRHLGLPITFSTDWFVEFQLADAAHLSIADEARVSVKSSGGQGVTLALRVDSAETVWELLQKRGLRPEPLRDHSWGARAFYLFDPEGHRLEIWSSTKIAGEPPSP